MSLSLETSVSVSETAHCHFVIARDNNNAVKGIASQDRKLLWPSGTIKIDLACDDLCSC